MQKISGFAPFALTLVLATAIPGAALAVTEPQCIAMFEAADTNGNGILSANEIANSNDVPDELQDRELVTLIEFVNECAD